MCSYCGRVDRESVRCCTNRLSRDSVCGGSVCVDCVERFVCVECGEIYCSLCSVYEGGEIAKVLNIELERILEYVGPVVCYWCK